MTNDLSPLIERVEGQWLVTVCGLYGYFPGPTLPEALSQAWDEFKPLFPKHMTLEWFTVLTVASFVPPRALQEKERPTHD